MSVKEIRSSSVYNNWFMNLRDNRAGNTKKKNSMENAENEKITFEKWDLADHINTKEDIEGILEAALEENDTALLLAVIGDIARSKGMTQIAKELNVARESLYRSLSSDGNPSFSTIVKVLNNLGFQLSVRQKVPA
jgi:probable addiction module antidote protein